MLTAVKNAHEKWGIGVGGDAPDVKALQTTATARADPRGGGSRSGLIPALRPGPGHPYQMV